MGITVVTEGMMMGNRVALMNIWPDNFQSRTIGWGKHKLTFIDVCKVEQNKPNNFLFAISMKNNMFCFSNTLYFGYGQTIEMGIIH